MSRSAKAVFLKEAVEESVCLEAQAMGQRRSKNTRTSRDSGPVLSLTVQAMARSTYPHVLRFGREL